MRVGSLSSTIHLWVGNRWVKAVFTAPVYLVVMFWILMFLAVIGEFKDEAGGSYLWLYRVVAVVMLVSLIGVVYLIGCLVGWGILSWMK